MLVHGEIIENRYRIEEEIGQGGMSHVYLATDIRTWKTWAVKETKKADANDALQQAYETEKLFLKKVAHPAFPYLVDAFETEDANYIIMEFVAGEKLDYQIVRKRHLAQEQIYEMMKSLCEALAYLHGTVGAIYGDLKPSNVIVQKNNQIKLIDFGSVQLEQKRYRYQMGTPGYAAPEQLTKEGRYADKRSDVYSFGVIFYELLTGKRFEGSLMQNPFVTRNLRNLIFRCTRLNPNSRYEDMQEVLSELKQKERKKGFLFLSEKDKNPFLLREIERTILAQDNYLILGKE